MAGEVLMFGEGTTPLVEVNTRFPLEVSWAVFKLAAEMLQIFAPFPLFSCAGSGSGCIGRLSPLPFPAAATAAVAGDSESLVTPPATPSDRMIWVPGVMGVPGGGPPL